MTEASQKATVEDTVSQISRALNAGARMILEQPFESDYIPNKYALDAWNHRADLPAAVTVKPLEWDGRKTTDVMFQYRVHIGYGNMNGAFALTLSGSTIGEYHSEEAAKAAAQADYERRILSCLTTQPDPVKDAARENRLAECLSDLCLAARRSRDLINTKVSDLDVITFTATKGQLKAALRALRALAEQEQSE